MRQEYKDLVTGIETMGEALIKIGSNEDNKPIKMLVVRLIENLGFNSSTVGDDIAMIKFAVENDDESLERLTAKITGNPPGPVPKVKTAPETEDKETK